jgi:hypothetical protein
LKATINLSTRKAITNKFLWFIIQKLINRIKTNCQYLHQLAHKKYQLSNLWKQKKYKLDKKKWVLIWSIQIFKSIKITTLITKKYLHVYEYIDKLLSVKKYFFKTIIGYKNTSTNLNTTYILIL